MSKMFEVSELVKVAVEDERTGVAFYSALAKKVQDPGLKQTFHELAEQEKVHQKRFEEMLAGMGAPKAAETRPGEYDDYLQALTSDRAFPDERAARKTAQDCGADAEALALARRFERDTLLLMREMQGMVRPEDAAVVEELIEEERSHLVVLARAAGKP